MSRRRGLRGVAESLARSQGVPVPSRARAARQPPAMNGLERAYAERLELLRSAGEIRTWRFEAVKLRLGRHCHYTPDFVVVTAADVVELHEVKGHWEDDARVKIRVAAELYPWWRFLAITGKKGQDWQVEELDPYEVLGGV